MLCWVVMCFALLCFAVLRCAALCCAAERGAVVMKSWMSCEKPNRNSSPPHSPVHFAHRINTRHSFFSDGVELVALEALFVQAAAAGPTQVFGALRAVHAGRHLVRLAHAAARDGHVHPGVLLGVLEPREEVCGRVGGAKG